MGIEIISMFIVSLALTLIIEIIVARAWGLKSKKERKLVVLVNILTNPVAVFFSWICNNYLGNNFYFLAQCLIEIVVIVVEAELYLWFAKEDGWNIKKPIQFAIIVNMISWLSGVAIQCMNKIYL